MTFSPETVDRFRITSFTADLSKGTAVLRYSLDDEYEFEESFDFGGTKLSGASVSPGAQAGFERVVRLLHLVAGVSYYKTAAPRQIAVETGDDLTDEERHLCHDVYDSGLREFAYRNGLRLPREIDITTPLAPATMLRQGTGASPDPPAHGIGIPVGGGKDSIVVLEGLRDHEGRRVLVSVNPSPAAERIAEISGLEMARVQRRIDPLLFDLNEQGALNGHVPVTAIVALASVAAGYVHGYDTTAMALESSADDPTREVESTDVNHQWSKSIEFERQLQSVLRHSVHESLSFLSPLRRFNELEVAGAFSRLTPYLPAFRSCNRAFRIKGAVDGWCRDCPKCRFVFLALSTALERDEVVRVFGGDMLDDESQLEGFSDMLDPQRKPFECVGTVAEVSTAFAELCEDPSWSGAVVVERMRAVLGRTREIGHGRGESPGASPDEVFEAVRRSISRVEGGLDSRALDTTTRQKAR